MKDWPPVLFVSGSEAFLRRRFVSEVMSHAQAENRVIDHVDGSRRGAVEDALSTGVLMATETLVVVTNPEKVALDVLEEHNKAGDSTFILLLHVEGSVDARTKFGKLAKKLNTQHRSFPSPKSWEGDKVAVEFVMEEAKRFGKTIELKTAQALVSVMGSNLGILHYELLKASTLATARGTDVIGIPEVKKTIAPIAEADVFPAIRALEDQNLKRTLQCLDRVRNTSKADPTMKVCRIMGSTVQKWLQAAALEAEGYDANEAASLLGQNPWFYRNKVLPVAMRWRRDGVVRLIHAIARSERAVLNGHVDPWSGFLARMVSAFPDSR